MLSEGTSLLSLVAALVGVTLLLGGAIVIVEAAFIEADRDTSEQVLAEGYSDRLLEAAAVGDGHTNVVDAEQLSTAATAAASETDQYQLHVSLGERSLTNHGEPSTKGATVNRLVMVVDEEVKQTGATITIPSGVPTVKIHTAPDGRILLNGTSMAVDTPTAISLDPTTETAIAADEPITVSYPRIGEQAHQLTVTVEPSNDP